MPITKFDFIGKALGGTIQETLSSAFTEQERNATFVAYGTSAKKHEFRWAGCETAPTVVGALIGLA